MSDIQVIPAVPPIPTVAVAVGDRRRDLPNTDCRAAPRNVEAGRLLPKSVSDDRTRCAVVATSTTHETLRICCVGIGSTAFLRWMAATRPDFDLPVQLTMTGLPDPHQSSYRCATSPPAGLVRKELNPPQAPDQLALAFCWTDPKSRMQARTSGSGEARWSNPSRPLDVLSCGGAPEGR